MSLEPRSSQGTFTLSDAFAGIGQGDFSHRVLISFSDLDRAKLRGFESSFPELEESDRARLIQALAELNELSIEYDFNRVFRAALNDPSDIVRQRSVAALWASDESELVELFSGLLEDKSIDVRAEAASALGRFAALCETDELPAETSDELYARLKELAISQTEPSIVCRRALESLGNFASRVEVRDIIERAYEDEDQTIRAGALFAMGRTMDARWFDVLMQELISHDPELRYEAARALGLIGDTRAVEGLARLASDEDGEVRIAAIASIGAIGSPGSERVLRRLAERSNDEDEIAAIMDALEVLEELDSDRMSL